MIEERAEARYQEEQAEYEQRMAERAEKEERTGQKIRGRKPKPPEPDPRDKDQVNFTDPESRIMPTSENGWQQAYNAQSAVDMDSHLIVVGHLSQATNDKQQLQPTLDTLDGLADAISHPENIVADNGYYSEDNASEVADRKMTPYLATGCQKHNERWDERRSEPGLPPDDPTPLENMQWRLQTPEGKDVYGR